MNVFLEYPSIYISNLLQIAYHICPRSLSLSVYRCKYNLLNQSVEWLHRVIKFPECIWFTGYKEHGKSEWWGIGIATGPEMNWRYYVKLGSGNVITPIPHFLHHIL